jgi:hypothetical protein
MYLPDNYRFSSLRASPRPRKSKRHAPVVWRICTIMILCILFLIIAGAHPGMWLAFVFGLVIAGMVVNA